MAVGDSKLNSDNRRWVHSHSHDEKRWSMFWLLRGRKRLDTYLPPRWPYGLGLVLLTLFIQLMGSSGAARRQLDATELDGLAYGLLLLGPLALLVRHRFPVSVVFVNTVATIFYCLGGYPLGPCFAAPTVAVFVAVQQGKRIATWIIVGTGFVLYWLIFIFVWRESGEILAHSIGGILWLCTVLALAEVVRVGRERAKERYLAQRELQRRQTSEERLNIAREIHDVLAHYLSLINVQSSVALHLSEQQTDSNPVQTRKALAAIKQASKEALQQLRSTLGVLRQVDEDAPYAPAPSLARLDELLASVNSAGVAVTYKTNGDLRLLPPNVDLAAYRIVQEALTNVRRHAGPTTAHVDINYQPDEILLEIVDAGPVNIATRTEDASIPAGSGTGIVGMTERATALGGQLTAGPEPEGGFRVFARLPINGEHE